MADIRGASEISEFILKNYSGKVVEIGAGSAGGVAARLKPLDVIATDIDSYSLGSIQIKRDDIFCPVLEIYEGASLLYSIRPPFEIQLAMGMLALEIGADVLIRPISDEIADLPGFRRSLVNIGEASFYLFKPNR